MITKDKGTKYFCTSDVFHKDLMSRQEKHVLARYNDTFRCSHNPMAMAYAASGRPLANTAGIDFFSQRSKSSSIYTKSPLSSGKKGRGENGAFPPTRNGCIHSLSMRERG